MSGDSVYAMTGADVGAPGHPDSAAPTHAEAQPVAANDTHHVTTDTMAGLPDHAALTIHTPTAPSDTAAPLANRSLLYPESIVQYEHHQEKTHHNPTPQPRTSTAADSKQPDTAGDAAHGALFIYPKKIDNLRRFRMLFVGLLVSISSSTQVMHSVFGVIYMQTVYLFDVREMTVIYLAGTAVGMFTFPFAVLYDWFGPRLPIAVASAIGAVGHLLLALTFAGHIPHTVAHCAVFYAIMCWGCYGLDVVVVPTVLTHMPRDRGVPVGMLQTFSTFGGSIFTCWFRGFFEGNYSNLMWFLFAVMVVVGIVGTWYLEDAPYVVNRWRRRRITPRQQLRAFLIRNRYMSQLVPQRRYTFMTMVLILMNVYLFIQGVCVGYLAADITPGKLRGIAIGAIVLFLLILILVVPVNAIDGLSEQDKEVIAAAREKEAALRAIQAERNKKQTLDGEVRVGADVCNEIPRHGSDETNGGSALFSAGEAARATQGAHVVAPVELDHTPAEHSERTAQEKSAGDRPAPRLSPHRRETRADSAPSPRDRDMLTDTMGLPLYAQATPGPTLLAVDIEDDDTVVPVDEAAGEVPQAQHDMPSRQRTFSCALQSGAPSPHRATSTDALLTGTPRTYETSLTLVVDDHGEVRQEERRHIVPNPLCPAEEAEGPPQQPAGNSRNPCVETINLCDEVYVVPVYNTTFLQSLMNLDIWLVFYTTLCVWGVGLTMLGSWNVQTMLKARFAGMTYQHYVLLISFCGLMTAMGRVFLGIYERLLKVVRERTGVAIVPTLIYPIASLGLFLGMILWIALPGNMGLLAAYIVSAYFYGMNTSATFYVISTIFARDIGTHYGFCFLGAGIGFVLCYWCSWYLTYSHEATSGRCIGERRCMNRAVGIYICLVFSSFLSSFWMHRRYFTLVHGELEFRRIVAARKRALLRCCCGCCLRSGDESVESDAEKDEECKRKTVTGQ